MTIQDEDLPEKTSSVTAGTAGEGSLKSESNE